MAKDTIESETTGELLNQCPACEEWKPLDQFYETDPMGCCAACREIISNGRRSSERYFIDGKIRSAVARARSKGHDFDISYKWVIDSSKRISNK